ncbi:hypothetical protein N9494_00940 [Polaribacter sp.]|nr:hypothetical protein [Polaribacter sp.]|tara:strand:+ start:1329 stop:2075 length:747 start_codon:yes stop_codon:yes gene_type:complete
MKKLLLLKHITLQLFVLTVAYDLFNNFRMLLFSSFMIIVFLASFIVYFYKKNKFKNLQKIKYGGALYVYIIFVSILIVVVGDFIPHNYTNPIHNLFTNYKIVGLNDGETIETPLTDDNGDPMMQYTENFRYHVNVDDFKENNYLIDSFGEFRISGSFNKKRQGSFSYEYIGDDLYFENEGNYLNVNLFENKQIAFVNGYKNFYDRKIDVNQFRLPLDYLKNFILYNLEKILILFLFFYYRGFIEKKEK